MTTDPLNLAAFAVFTFCVFALVGGVRFVRYLLTVKESAMHGDLSRTPAPVAVHIHNAREVKHLTTPIGGHHGSWACNSNGHAWIDTVTGAKGGALPDGSDCPVPTRDDCPSRQLVERGPSPAAFNGSVPDDSER
jgi:hypothetical protein